MVEYTCCCDSDTKCGSGGTADALASGASGGNPVEVQILSTAPFFYLGDYGRAQLEKVIGAMVVS